ncbi:SDR family NAD(P)-dependent oxidoreductase [Streptomyces sulphureus]|uniref:SDR family NAD(P)-dependent oxidoreductase n=1 Tax=Streptomyces sulphureus TaxID=47758 RepID=UPI00037D10E2|nr:SDR family NAD(P)-dependent oxidoreductase [Streptomyces sulphureus]
MPPADHDQSSTLAAEVPAQEGELHFPASYAQQRMWFFHRLERGNPFYNIPLALRLTGDVDRGALRAALDDAVARHEILRTTFAARDDEPVQMVAASGTVELEAAEVTAEQEQERAREWVARPFDLAEGPLFRAALLTTAPDRHLLLLCLHHIVTDGWSLNVLTRELAAFYRHHLTGEPTGLEPLEIQYADFAEWQRARLGGGELDRLLAHWSERLNGDLPLLEMPTDRTRPEVQSFRGARVDFDIPGTLAARLRETARAHGATLFMALLAGVAALLHRYSGQEDILIGSPVAGRDQTETESLLGLFVNTLPLRTDVSGEPCYAELLRRTRQTCTDAYSHQDVPLDKLVEHLQPERDPGRNPLFQVLFALQNPPRTEFALPGAELRAEALPRESTRFDLEFHLWEDTDRLHGAVVYSTDLFDGATVRLLTDHLGRLLAEAVRAPESPLAELPLGEAAGHTVPRGPAARTSVPEALAAQVRRTPSATALVTGDGTELDYAALAHRVARTARELHDRGIAAGRRVGVRLPAGTESAVATLALLRLGAVCVPTGPALPDAAAARWSADAGVDALLTDGRTDAVDGVDVIEIGDVAGATGAPDSAEPADPPPGDTPRGDAPAFVVLGGDGPVALRHADLCDSADWLQDRTPLAPGDVVLHHTAAPLAASVHALLWPLLHGAAVSPAEVSDGAGLGAAVDDLGVTVALLPPTRLGALVAHAESAGRPEGLRLVLTDGGRLTPALADRFHRACGVALHWLWALPEAGGFTAALHARPGYPEGDLVAAHDGNRPVTVTDARGCPLPDGLPGSLHVTPHGASAPRPTGRQGRRLPDGRLTFADDASRVRLDGFDVPRADIECAVLADESVGACAVLPRVTTGGVEELVAYVVPAGAFHPRRLRERVAALLPAPLVPRAFSAVTALPHDRGGRLHTSALAALPVLDEELAARWERESPGSAVLVEDAGTAGEDEERVHVGSAGGGERSAAAPPPEPEAGKGRSPAVAGGAPPPELDVRTLPQALRRAAEDGHGGLVLVDRHGKERSSEYAELAAEAARVLRGVRAMGLAPGERVLLQCPDNHDFLVAFWGCVLGGLVPVPLAPAPDYAQDSTAVDRLATAFDMLGRPPVLTDEATAAELRALGERRGWQNALRLGVLDELRRNAPDPAPHAADPEDVAVLLLTSGSTGRPKAVPLRHRNILARCAATSLANGFTRHDVTFNWMPLDHVGGVVMFHVRDVYLGCKQIHATTQGVLEDPLRWLEAVHRHRVTLTWAPNFAFGLVNDRAEEAVGNGWNLSCLRFIQNAGEAIMPRVARRFLQALRPLGLPETAMHPSWGMSETSSAVTYSDTFTLATTSESDQFTDVGRPLPGTAMRIVGDGGETVPEGVAGRLQVKGPTVTSGYDDNEEENRASFTSDGWFETGDLGVLENGSLTITGRAKDVLIINGVNYYCHEIESVAEELDAVENSFTAACAVQEPSSPGEVLALFVHLRPDAEVADALREVRARVVGRTGLNPHHVLPVAREEIPKTEIGKIQRARLRERFHTGGFDDLVARTDLLLGNERTLPNWFHERVWRPARPMPGPAASEGAPVLLLSDAAGLAGALADRLAAQGRRCARVDLGEGYAREYRGHYRIRGERPEDHERLLDALAADGFAADEIVDLTTYAPRDETGADVPVETAALVHLVQAVAARRGAEQQVTLRVVGRHTQQVADGEAVDCGRAARLALMAAFAQEAPWLLFSHLDLPEAPPEEQVPHVLRELGARRGESEAAVRGGRRLVPRIAALPAVPRSAAPLPRGALYVVTGGLGGLGAEVCAHLLDAYDARLLVLGRTALPPEGEGADDRRAQAYRSLRTRSEHVLYVAADVCREEEVGRALRQARDRWNLEPAAVLHLAGVFGQRPFLEQSVDELAEAMAPKTRGARVLLDALAPHAAFVGFSSVNGTFGGAMVSAYAAANASLDALVRNRYAKGGAARSLAWSMWDELGMSRGLGLAEPGRARGYRPLGRAEGLRSLVHALRHDRPHVLVGLDPSRPWIRGRLDAPARTAQRLTAYTESAPGTDRPASLPDRYGVPVDCRLVNLDALPRTADGEVDRSALRDADRPREEAGPAEGTQRLVARVWCEVLGLDRVGTDENFFDLGGHSLQMSRVHSLLEAGLKREFSMVDLFRHPTVASLAAFLDGLVSETAPNGTGSPDDTGTSRLAGRRRAERRQAGTRGRRRRG